jgi:hypothetical protein
MLVAAPIATNGYYDDIFNLNTTISGTSVNKGFIFDAAVLFDEQRQRNQRTTGNNLFGLTKPLQWLYQPPYDHHEVSIMISYDALLHSMTPLLLYSLSS